MRFWVRKGFSDGPTFIERQEMNERSDVHGVDHQKKSFRESHKWVRNGSRRLEWRDIKAEIDAHRFCHNEDTVPKIQNLLWRITHFNENRTVEIHVSHQFTRFSVQDTQAV